MTQHMEVMEGIRQLKLGNARAYYHHKKATYEAYAKKLNEEAHLRHERRRQEDPAYAAKRLQYSRAQNERRKEDGTRKTYRELRDEDNEKYGYAKRKEDALQYNIKNCQDPEFRINKMSAKRSYIGNENQENVGAKSYI